MTIGFLSSFSKKIYWTEEMQEIFYFFETCVTRNVIKSLQQSTGIKMRDKKTRMSIDVSEKEHKKIKMHVAKLGMSIRKFVTDCIQERIFQKTDKQKSDDLQ